MGVIQISYKKGVLPPRGPMDPGVRELFPPESIDSRGFINFPRPQNRIREGGLIGRIREMLGFEAQSGAITVGNARLTGQCTVEKIPPAKLQSGFRGPDFHETAARRIMQRGGKFEPA